MTNLRNVGALFIIFFIALFCLSGQVDAAKGCKDRDNDNYYNKAGCGTSRDCNDNNPSINPGAVEVCENGIDENCDGQDDACPVDCTDNDGDGYGDGADCLGPDCNDTDPAVNPDAAEVCDGIDNNCDTNTDEGFDNDSDGYTTCADDCNDSNPAVNPGAAEVPYNGEDDDCNVTTPDDDLDGDSYPLTTDCNDNDSSINPGAVEVCENGIDENCDGQDDACPVDCTDNDGDGYGDGADCLGPDCNDTDPAVNPDAAEICDGIDNNCDTNTDEGFDNDSDGYTTCADDCNDSNPAVNPGAAEVPYNGEDDDCNVTTPDDDLDGDSYPIATDCNDNDPSINPAATDVCENGIDENCDGQDDACPVDCTDSDGDGYGIGASCLGTDCDDNDPAVHPGAAEICDGKDNDCDGWQAATDVDNDGDNYPVCANDCDDNDATSYPAAPELCDGLDNDCNYIPGIDELDFDGDGYFLCDAVPDCDDSNAATFPGAVEIYDGEDNDCDGEIDEGITCPDADLDGQLLDFCGGTDCDDSAPDVYLGALEICTDGIDNDCDGLTDIQDPDAVNCPSGCKDTDGDTYYIDTVGGLDCGPVDCDDSDPNVYPGASEICDGKDSNCDGWKPPTDVDNDGDGVPICASDCNDNDPVNFPGNIEICDDGNDNDCDYAIDSVDPDCQFSCNTKTSPKNGPHMFNLLEAADDSVIKSSCNWCHFDDAGTVNERTECQRCHADPADTSDPLNGVLKELYPLNPPYGFGTAINVMMHSSSVLGTKYGSWDMSCLNCHNPHTQEQDKRFKTSYGKYIKEYICYSNNVTEQNLEELVRFTAATGNGSFADGPPHNENICETCHTATNHHQNDGTAPGGQSHYDGDRCMDCHSHDSGFKPGAGGQSHDTHLTGVKGPELGCETGCHGTNLPPLFADGNDLASTTVCNNCHSPGGSFDGVNDPVTGAKANWVDSIYDGKALQPGKEKWCAGCHDEVPGNSKIDGSGIDAPNMVGDNVTYGFYVSGHGNDIRVNCTNCHDASKKHIDHLYTPLKDVVRTVENPTNYRFYDGKGMELPHSARPPATSDDFRLCFTCHDEAWYSDSTTFGPGLETNFRLDNPTIPDLPDWNVQNGNLHWYHLYGLGTAFGAADCVLCHDPHGSDRPVMATIDIDTFSYLGGGSGIYFELDPSLWDDPASNAGGVITSNPQTCGDCHSEPTDTDLANGLPGDGARDGWYLRQYKPHTFPVPVDIDGDGLSDDQDNCTDAANSAQTDTDGDNVGDACDNCLIKFNSSQADTDRDGIGNACDPSCDTSVAVWRRQFGTVTATPQADFGTSVAVDNNDNIYVTGRAGANFPGATPNYSWGSDVFLRKYGPDGNEVWTEQAATALNTDFPEAIAIDSSGNIFVTGHTEGTFPGQTNQGGFDIFLIKFQPDKTISWIKEIGSVQDDKASGVAVDNSGNVYVTGVTQGNLCGTLDGTHDYFLLRFSSQNGTSECIAQDGTSSDDRAHDVAVDSAGNPYVVGYTYGSFPGFTNTGDTSDAFVVKYDQTGSRQWLIQIGTDGSDQANGVDLDAADNVYIAGSTSGTFPNKQSSGSSDVFLIKYDMSGNHQWTSQGGGSGSEATRKIAVDPAGNSYITGSTGSYLDGFSNLGGYDVFIIKYLPDGTRHWAKQWGGMGDDYSFDVALDSSGDYYIAGQTDYVFEPPIYGYYDVIFLKGSEICQ